MLVDVCLCVLFVLFVGSFVLFCDVGVVLFFLLCFFFREFGCVVCVMVEVVVCVDWVWCFCCVVCLCCCACVVVLCLASL